MVREDRSAWKASYFIRLLQLFEEYPKCFIVGVDNVGSKQMQTIRSSLREHAVLLMGKNTMIRKAIRGHLEQNPNLEKLLPCVKGNVGFVFTKEDLVEIRDKILDNRVPAAAKAGAIAPVNVKIPPQNTGLGPEKTSFFQALAIPTKISRGTIEILNEVHLIKINEKVGASEAALLNMLKISPFTYGLVIENVYDSGTVFEPSILDLTDAQLLSKFQLGVANIAAISLAIGYPTQASISHSVVNAFRNILAVAVQTDYDMPEAEMAKEFLKDPSKFAAAAAPAAGGEAKEEVKEEAKKEESEDEESDDDMGFALFD